MYSDIYTTCRRFKTFVSNRVARILRSSDPSQWRHVQSNGNPADVLSHGCFVKDLSGLWRYGPKFLNEQIVSVFDHDEHVKYS